MRRLVIASLSLAALAGLPAGCTTDGGPHLPVYLSDDRQVLQEPTGAGLVAMPQSPIPDVPLPIGFVVLNERSRWHAMPGGGRSVQHAYQGRAARGDLLEFYRRQLPAAGWQLVSEQLAAGENLMTFTKGGERLVIGITYPRQVATVRVTIDPIVAMAPATRPTPR